MDGPASVAAALTEHGYLPDEGLATAVFLAITLHRPLLLEGDAGVGKTELAKALSRWTGGELLRLQCYEGLDVSSAVYEWDHARQLLHLRAAEAAHVATSADELEAGLYDERFLVRRPLLEAVTPREGPPPVLLVDEVDRADDEFEAFLLEVLSDWAVTVPELGTIRAIHPPLAVITSNRTRDVHDALKRRCLYHWVEHPSVEREVEIIRLRAPQVSEALAEQVARRRGAHPRRRRLQAARRGRDHRLGHGRGHPRPRRARPGDGRRHPGHRPQVPGGPGPASACSGWRSWLAADVVTGFAERLRARGLAVPSDTLVTYARALDAVGLDERSPVYWAGRATLVRRPEDRACLRRRLPRLLGGAGALHPPVLDQCCSRARSASTPARVRATAARARRTRSCGGARSRC
jgi:MoxR-like ATPase